MRSKISWNNDEQINYSISRKKQDRSVLIIPQFVTSSKNILRPDVTKSATIFYSYFLFHFYFLSSNAKFHRITCNSSITLYEKSKIVQFDFSSVYYAMKERFVSKRNYLVELTLVYFKIQNFTVLTTNNFVRANLS